MSDENQNPYVELMFAPSWELISDVRRFVGVFFQRTLGHTDAASRVALAAHELLENAAKYSSDGEAILRLEVLRDDKPWRLRLRIRNCASGEETARLKERFAAMAECEPFEYYQKLIRTARGSRSRAGLGLARIQAEAEMMLECDIDGDQVEIKGTTTVDA